MIAVKHALRPWRCPIYETRNRCAGRAGIRRNVVFQETELRRLRGAAGHRPTRAEVLAVIPTFVRPEGLTAAVESALAQTHRDLAVIVVDDGGGLPALPDDPRLTAVSLSRNTATVGLVRNIGMALADSEFIAFLDDDNVWTADHVATAVSALKADPTVAAVYTYAQRLRPDGSVLDVLGEPFSRRKLMHDPYIDANTVVVRRSHNRDFSVLRRTKETLPKEDWEYLWRLSRRGRIKHVPHVTVRYAVNPASYFTEWAMT